jgi:CHU_C Type IX secretion signal domain/IPT/TIG domain
MEKMVRFGRIQSRRQFALSLFFVFVVHQLCAQQTALLEWAKGLSGNVVGYSVALDASGNVFTSGYLEGTADFDPGPGVFNLTSAGQRDIFVSKLDANGNFVWAKVMGGTDYDDAYTITIDAFGNVFTYGLFRGTADFDPGAGTFNLTSAGCYFISKLDNNGNFIFAKAIQAPNASTYSQCKLMVTDPSGNIYVAGDFGGTGDFDPGPGVFNMTANGTDVFVSKLDNNGNLIWAKLLTGINNQISKSIGLDAAGNVYTAGILGFTMDFDPGPGVFNLTSLQNDVFISKLDTDGNFVWAKQMTVPNNSDRDFPDAITIDGSGNIYALGLFSGTVDFDPGPGVVNLTAVAPYDDIFVSKWDPNGNFLWAATTGGDTNSQGSSIATDAAGNVYTLGRFSGTVDFDPGASVFNLTSAGISDVYLSKLDPSGNFLWAQSSGGVSTDVGTSITIDGAGKLYTTGYFTGPADFDPGACVLNLAGQMFVQKLFPGTRPSAPTITSFSPLSGAVGTAVTITGTNFSATSTNNAVSFFNSKTATVTTSTPITIDTSVPVGATTGKISITANCVTVQSTTNFTVGAALLPTITSFAPFSGPVGTTVTITGTNFSATAASNTVKFNGTTAAVSASSTTSITTTVPAGATTGQITVTVAGNIAASAASFTVTPSSPNITSFNPSSGQVGTAVTIIGINFSVTPANNVVKFNGTVAVVTVSTTTSIATSVPSGATTGKITVTVGGNTATSALNFTVSTGPTNSPPVITTQSLTTQVGGIVTLDLVPLITAANNNLDINSIQVSAPPASGAIAAVTSGVLRVDYTGIGFIGIEQILIHACDLNSNCATQQYSIDVVGEIVVYNGLSPNGANPILVIKNIELLPETKGNNVIIYDRWQSEVWHGKGYDNFSVVFTGISDKGSDLPTGTYYYRIEFEGGRKSQTGFISLKR